MNPELLVLISDFLSTNEMYRGAPATKAQLDYAVERLGVPLDDSYREFISLFGGSYVGVPIWGFNNCSMLPDEDVVALTLNFRRTYAATGRWAIIQQSYVIAMTGSGDPVILDQAGQVRVYYHDSNTEEILAATFAELIVQNLPAESSI